MQGMQGVLFRYGPKPAQIAFRSAPGCGVGGSSGGAASASTSAAPAAAPSVAAAAAGGAEPRRHLVLVAGMTEGLLCLPYAGQVAAAAEGAGYQLVQAQLSTAYQGWGTGSLDQDADELLLLSRHLRAELGSEGVVVMGHSTGCQDAVRFAQRHGHAEGAAPLRGIILQAPASDREWLSANYPDLVARLPQAQSLVDAGKGAEIVATAFGAPLAASRLVALAARLGDDDMFSMDLMPAELQERLGHLSGWPLLVLQSGSDECVPDPSTIPVLGERILQAAGGAEASSGAEASGGGKGAGLARRHVVVPGAPHSAEGHEGAVAAAVGEFLAALQQQAA